MIKSRKSTCDGSRIQRVQFATEQRQQALQAWDPNSFEEESKIVLAGNWQMLDEEQNAYEESFLLLFIQMGKARALGFILKQGKMVEF